MRLQIILLAPLLGVGCGTLQNVSPLAKAHGEATPKQFVFGGVRQGSQQMRDSIEDLKQYPNTANGVVRNLGQLTLHAIDTPISAVGDTLTLPITVPAAVDRIVANHYFPNRTNAAENQVPLRSDSESTPLVTTELAPGQSNQTVPSRAAEPEAF